MTTITITPERIGRGTPPPPWAITITEPHTIGGLYDAVAEDIFRVARRRLASRMFAVCVYPDGTWAIEGGRFGKGTWASRQGGAAA